MRKIKIENIKVNDWLYIIDETNNRIFVLEIWTNRGDLMDTYYWGLHKENRKKLNFEGLMYKGNYLMRKSDWKPYTIFKLNKAEVRKFKNALILNNL